MPQCRDHRRGLLPLAQRIRRDEGQLQIKSIAAFLKYLAT